MGITVVGFDFSGCGQSEGKYVTLGFYEQHDVRAMIQYLESHYSFKKFVLWGRSMGSVAALMYMNTWKSESRIKGLILDSPFSDFLEVCKYYARHSNFGGFLLDWGLEAVNDITMDLAGLNIENFKPIKFVRQIKVPAIFIGGSKDKIIPTDQVRTLFNHYGGQKELKIVNQGHNTKRPAKLLDHINNFIKKQLGMSGAKYIRKSQSTERIGLTNKIHI